METNNENYNKPSNKRYYELTFFQRSTETKRIKCDIKIYDTIKFRQLKNNL